jgi:prepilin-type N-terminal cleavage/methylation domain-containing protein
MANRYIRGLTLIEFVIVLAIAGVLSAIAIPVLHGIIIRAQYPQAEIDAAHYLRSQAPFDERTIPKREGWVYQSAKIDEFVLFNATNERNDLYLDGAEFGGKVLICKTRVPIGIAPSDVQKGICPHPEEGLRADPR